MTEIQAAPPRFEAELKVTGKARYPGEAPVANLAHAAYVQSTIARGEIEAIDVSGALAIPGVICVLTHEDFPKIGSVDFFQFLQGPEIVFAGQPIAMVIAESGAAARHAASKVTVGYRSAPPVMGLAANLAHGIAPEGGRFENDSLRGDPDAGLRRADVVVSGRFTTATNNHHPIEPCAIIAWWEDDELIIHTTTQAIFGTRRIVGHCIGHPREKIRVITKYLGGGFGVKGTQWFSTNNLVVLAAKKLGRPLKLEMTRAQMFEFVGRRQETIHDIAIGASRDGKLTAITHHAVAQTSVTRDYSESNAVATRWLYACPNVATTHRVVRLNATHPIPMRAPGTGPCTFVLESALDELSYAVELDPVELRLRNYAAHDQQDNRPWSSNGLLECYRVAADAFGWSRRPPTPRSMRDGRLSVGWGMASACYPVHRQPADACVRIDPEGRVSVLCGTQDMGAGTFNVLAQFAAETLGVPVQKVSVEIGDTTLPEGPYSAGSMVTASVAPAVESAARALRQQLLAAASADALSPVHGVLPDHLAIDDGVVAEPGTNRSESLVALMRRVGRTLEGHGSAKPDAMPKFSANGYGAVFAEVRVDEDLNEIRVTRLTAAYAAGRVLNKRLAHSQLMGGLVMGIGMALHEKTVTDDTLGRIVGLSLSDYLIPVHADMPAFDIHMIDEHDSHLPGGIKGIGMLGTVGTAGAIANAVFHATGRRARDLPIRLDQCTPTAPHLLRIR